MVAGGGRENDRMENLGLVFQPAQRITLTREIVGACRSSTRAFGAPAFGPDVGLGEASCFGVFANASRHRRKQR